MKKHIARIIIYIAVMILSAALFCKNQPTIGYTYTADEDSLLASYEAADIIGTQDCTVQGYRIKATGSDPYIEFQAEDADDAVSVMICFKKPLKKFSECRVYVDRGDGYAEADSDGVFANEGDTCVGFNIDCQDAESIRIDVNQSYQLDEVRLYSSEVDIESFVIAPGYGGLVKGLILGLVVCLLLSLLDMHFCFFAGMSERIRRCLTENRKNILICAAVALASAALAFVINGFEFSVYLSAILISAALSAAILLLEYRSAEKKPEKTAALLIVLIGLAMMICTPETHVSYDVEMHYSKALAWSSFDDINITDADAEIVDGGDIFNTTDVTPDQNEEIIRSYEEKNEYYVRTMAHSRSLAHAPAGIMLAILQLFGTSFWVKYTFAKIANLLLFALLVYFGMKRLHSGKMILAVIAMFPSCIFVASNYSYDYWVTGFSLLGMAYFVGCCQEKDKPVSTKDLVIMMSAFAIACIPKAVYICLCLIPFFMNPKKIPDQKKYYGICCVIIFLALLFLAYMSLHQITGGGDTRGGDVRPAQQIIYILTHPFTYAGILLRFLTDYMAPANMDEYVTEFGHLGSSGGLILAQLLMMVTVLTDRNEYDSGAYSVWQKILVILAAFAQIAVVATTMYIVFTPYQLGQINGCQERYIVPMLYPLVSMLFCRGIRLKLDRRIYNTVVMAGMAGLSFYGVWTMLLPLVWQL